MSTTTPSPIWSIGRWRRPSCLRSTPSGPASLRLPRSRTLDNYDEATATASPEERAAQVKAFVDAPTLQTAPMPQGSATPRPSRSVSPTASVRSATGRQTRATIDGIHRVGHGGRIRPPDRAAISATSTALPSGRSPPSGSDLAADPYDIKPGEYEVVLAPECVATIAVFLGVYGFNGKAVNEGQSFLDVGAQQFDQSISVWDDPFAPGSLGLAFDADGTPKRRVPN